MFLRVFLFMFALYFPHRLKDLECPQDNDAAAEVAPPRIIDESWLFGQVSGSPLGTMMAS